MQQALLFQAYGDMGNINECRFSLLKYFAVYNNKPPLETAIFIYTDQPNYFLPYTEFFSGIQTAKSPCSRCRSFGPEAETFSPVVTAWLRHRTIDA